MSVQRWTTTLSEARYRMDDGPFVLYADHARIVAEAQARWVEIARQDRMAAHQRGAQEAERQHAKALADMEQAHAAALAEEVQTHLDSLDILRAEHAAALAEAEHATAFYREVSQLRAADARAADARAAAPRTLTADDRPDYKWDQEEVDDLRRQGYERGLADARAAVDAVGRWRSFPDDTLLSRAAVLAAIDALIHDGGAA